MKVFVRMYVFSSAGCVLSRAISGFCRNFLFNLLRNCQTDFTAAVLFYIPTCIVRGVCFLPNTCLSFCKDFFPCLPSQLAFDSPYPGAYGHSPVLRLTPFSGHTHFLGPHLNSWLLVPSLCMDAQGHRESSEMQPPACSMVTSVLLLILLQLSTRESPVQKLSLTGRRRLPHFGNRHISTGVLGTEGGVARD